MKHRAIAWGLAVAMTSVAQVAPAAEQEEGSLHDLITVLRDRGVIDESDYENIAARNAAYEAKQKQERMPALSFWGDFRFRSEHLWYQEDETGSERTNRHRQRYRFRLNGKAEVNDHVDVLVRLVTGADDPRSANQTFGSGVDFDTDDFRLDRAYARISPFAHGRLGENGTLHFELGKTPNPYTWKRGTDRLLWDADISLEGVAALATWRPTEGLETFFNGGYHVIDENSTSKDPHMIVGQVGFHADLAESVQLGGRTSYYHFNSLDAAFHARGVDGTGGVTSAGGNIVDGLTGGQGGQNLQVVEAAFYLAMLTDTDWPVLFYGSWANNLTAEASVLTTADEEDTAWNLGVELGDKKKWVQLGVGYWHIEANAFPAQYIDSNITDGVTNRAGWVAFVSRNVWKNTDLTLRAFYADELEDEVPPFDESVSDAERVRLQADLVVKFK